MPIKFNKKPSIFFTFVGVILGFVVFFGLRVAFYDNQTTHYHANFALYVNGQQDTFDNFTYYQEVQSCSSDDKNDPQHRVHMHQPENNVVHVHENAVTWSDFFANLGYGLTNKLIATGDGVFVDGENGKKLAFILNGKPVKVIAGEVIKSEDVLLINYGDETNVDERYQQITQNAHEHNVKPDPASCSGQESLSFKDRLTRAINFRK